MRVLIVVCVSLTLLVVGCRQAPPPADRAPEIRAANQALLVEGNLGRVPDFFSETYLLHATDGDMRGRAAITDFVTAVRTAFPDLQVDIQVLATEGSRVAWLRTSRGTHQGDFMGVPASGRSLTWRDMVVTRYEGGLIAEEWGASELPGRIRMP